MKKAAGRAKRGLQSRFRSAMVPKFARAEAPVSGAPARSPAGCSRHGPRRWNTQEQAARMSEHGKIGGLLKNWVSLTGIFLGACAVTTGTVLMIVDAASANLSPYFGILVYLMVPGSIAGSGLLVFLGMLWSRRRLLRQGYVPRLPVIDLGNRRTLARIDDSLPSIKARSAVLLAAAYKIRDEALAAIDRELRAKYAGDPRVEAAILELQSIYSGNFFPEMKVRWDKYPNHVGHRISPGCFRCHDGAHVSDAGKRIPRDCGTCHTILAQGPGKQLAGFTSSGLEFQHPGDAGEDWKTERCDSCHTGSP